MPRQKRSFSSEFRAKAVAYVVEQGKPIAVAARELGIGESTLGNWVSTSRKCGAGRPEPMTSQERDELRAAKKQIRELEMRVEILKGAVAFFASETEN